jgi:hypothetical protein
MYISKLINNAVIVASIGAFVPATTAHADEGAIIGRVTHGGDSSVRVCFKQDVSVEPGEELAVIRHTLRTTSPKAAPILESAHVGVVRIAKTGDGHCASAVLVSGSAKWLDWVAVEAPL